MNERHRPIPPIAFRLLMAGLALLLPLVAGCGGPRRVRSEVDRRAPFATVRIALGVDLAQAVVTIDSGFHIYDYPAQAGRPILVKKPMVRTRILPDAENYFQFGDPRDQPDAEIRRFGPGALIIKPMKDQALVVNGVRFDGDLALIPKGNRRMDLINVVELDDYIASVVGSEMPSSWPMEALKAQAVAARTYGMYMKKRRTRQRKNYDLFRGVVDQAYEGVSRATPRTRLAARSTHDRVMKYNGQLFKAYYHAICGDHTEEVSLIFGDTRLRPLGGVKCGYCTHAPKYKWTNAMPKKLVTERLNRAGYAVGAVRQVRPLRRGAAHIITLAVDHAGGSLKMTADQFRKALGTIQIQSTNFIVIDNGPIINFDGRGFGHGVGMCQWGARSLAEKRSAAQILKYYYPGVRPSEPLNARDFR